MTEPSTLDRMSSFDLAVGDLDLRVTVVPPAGSHEPGSVPLVVVLDADLYVGTVAEQVELLHRFAGCSSALVVGVGYGGSVLDALGRRMGDLVPRPADVVLEMFPALAGPARGADGAFRAALLERVRPAVLDRWPEASADGNVLLGHSLGAHFVASTLLAAPGAFATYLAISPSLWWDAFDLVRRVRAGLPAALAGLPAPPRVAMAVGGLEQSPEGAAAAGLPPEHIEQARMVDAAHDLAGAIRAAGPDCPLTTYPGAHHQSVVPTAIYDLLHHALR